MCVFFNMGNKDSGYLLKGNYTVEYWTKVGNDYRNEYITLQAYSVEDAIQNAKKKFPGAFNFSII